MANYYVFSPSDPSGKILRYGTCPPEMIEKQAGPGEVAQEGIANDTTQKIVDGVVVDKTREEIDTAQPAPIAESEYPAGITGRQWNDLLARLDAMETQLAKHTTRLDTIETQLVDYGQLIGAAETGLAEHDERIGTVETELADHAKRIAALEAKVGITPGGTV